MSWNQCQKSMSKSIRQNHTFQWAELKRVVFVTYFHSVISVTQTDSVRLLFQINLKMVYTIWFRFDLIKFRKYFTPCWNESWTERRFRRPSLDGVWSNHVFMEAICVIYLLFYRYLCGMIESCIYWYPENSHPMNPTPLPKKIERDLGDLWDLLKHI